MDAEGTVQSDLARRHPEAAKKGARNSKKIANPLQAGILQFLSTRYQTNILELKDIPKRYTRYGSLLLLGPAFLAHSQSWSDLMVSLTVHTKAELYHSIIQAFKDASLTHIAINAPITAEKLGDHGQESNEIRSPVGLVPVYGDFGPGSDVCNHQYPTQADLKAAYWTRTVQLNNIVQVWAPRWTMFSRGNITEKSRILQADLSKSPFPGLSEMELGQAISKIDVVDFYVGIGYFAFCYLARGVARVWGWEINGWSVEGLRRGCIENGWPVRVVRINDDGSAVGDTIICDLVSEIAELENTPQAIKCIVFWGDNKWAPKVLGEIRRCLNVDTRGSQLNIKHCNLGLLPSSAGSWLSAIEVLNADSGGWLHVHENVQSCTILEKQQHIEKRLLQMTRDDDQKQWSADCHHIEEVKTYAPGVVHCVYDFNLYPSR